MVEEEGEVIICNVGSSQWRSVGEGTISGEGGGGGGGGKIANDFHS